MTIRLLFIFLFFHTIYETSIAQITATVDFSQIEGNPLEKIFAGYTSEKETNETSGLFVKDIYDSLNTLGPLNCKYHRMQLKADELSGGNPWIDENFHWQDKPSGSQEEIIKRVQQMGMINIVSVNTPVAVQRNAQKITDWYTSVAEAMVGFSDGKEIWLHIYGEPELWAWYTGFNTFEDFWWEFNLAYNAVAAVRANHPNLKIAGCGFAWGGMGVNTAGIYWYREFITRLINNGIKMNAITYHHFYQWDDTPLISTDQNAVITRYSNAKTEFDRYKNSQAAIGMDVKFHINEFSWVYGDWEPTFANSRSFISYRNTARAMDAMFYLALESFPGIDKIFWSQSVGEAFINADFWTFLPLVNWVEKSFYTYNAAYYSYWFYGKMPTSRKHLTFTNDSFRGLASSEAENYYLIAWNRTTNLINLDFNILGLTNDPSEYYCKISQVNSNNYNNRKQFPPSNTIELDSLGKYTIEPEATIMLEIWAKTKRPTYIVSFNVKDTELIPIKGSSVTLENETKLTDENGKAEFFITQGTYNYKVEKESFYTINEKISIENNDTINVTLNQPFDVSFIIKDPDNVSIEGAAVTLGAQSLVTSIDGIANFKVIKGIYDFKVEKDAYITIDEKIELLEQSVHIIIFLPDTFTITFYVKNELGIPFKGVKVSVGINDTIITDLNGTAVFKVIKGTYSFMIEKEFYFPIKLNVTVGKNNVVANLKMKNDATFAENHPNLKIDILPNPANDNFTIESIESIKKITLLDLRGQIVKNIDVNGSRTYNIYAGDIKSGSYIIQILTDKNIISKSIIIMH